MGAKRRPFYRLVVADARSPRDGKFIEQLGTYDPLTSPATVKIDAERVGKWLSQGAQPSDAARSLLQREGILEVTPHPISSRTGPKNAAKAEARAQARRPAEPATPEPTAQAAPADSDTGAEQEPAGQPEPEAHLVEAEAEPGSKAEVEAELVDPEKEPARQEPA